MKVLGISGSLRKGSFNTALLRAAIELAPKELEFTVAQIGDLPLYDEDLRAKGQPAPVQRLREQIAAADGILVATPEYNYSVPGVLKNAIDWASRPPNQPFAGKPMAIMGASGAMSGTMRAQYHLRQIAVFVDLHVMNRPEVFVRNGATMFTDGKLTDEPTRKVVQDHMTAFAAWIARFTAR